LKTDLRLLLDQCVQQELASKIKGEGSVRAIWVNDEPRQMEGAKDDDLMNEAKIQNRILVTVEGRINEKRYRICTHPGIIVFRANTQHEAVRADIFRSFMLSGHRSRAYKAITYLKLDGVTFRELRKDGTTAETSLSWQNIKQHRHREKTNYCDYRRGQLSM